MKIKKVLILGSGALKIGEAGEFDYSGSQAIKALKEEGIESVLINPNIATIQTSSELADKIYFLPVEKFFIEKVIKKEKPDSILLSFGGQTALNAGLDLDESGILKKYKVRVLGTAPETIRNTEDRELFANILRGIGVDTPRSFACKNKEEGFEAAEKIGFPLIVRSGFALGGSGSGEAKNKKALEKILDKSFSFAPQVLVEESLKGWKEIEYEVVRDGNDNCITVCNMENFDPLGIHTGESIVVAPSQTLDDHEYHKLRTIAIKTIRHLKIKGECNIQYALDPHSDEYRVIEVNARLSRSSALASKATGYPLAYIAAKIALGKNLPDIKNEVTKSTSAFFEPALDYLALKMPRWDLEKFREVSKVITTEMKSVGEVMALGRNFEEVLQKAIRMLEIGIDGLSSEKFFFKDLKKEMENPTPRRIFAIYSAILRDEFSLEEIHKLTGINQWFLKKIKNIALESRELKKGKIRLRKLKKLGFSDEKIARLTKKTSSDIRKMRKKENVIPVTKQIDTLAAEFPAQTNYLYTTYCGDCSDV